MGKQVSVYCKAYPLSALRRFDGWSDAMIHDAGHAAHDADATVFLHPDFRVSLHVVVDADDTFVATPAWRRYCVDVLRFSVPAELADHPSDDEATTGTP